MSLLDINDGWISRNRFSVQSGPCTDEENTPSSALKEIVDTTEISGSQPKQTDNDDDSDDLSAPRKRRRLKKAASDSNDGDDDETTIPFDTDSVAPTTVAVSKCSSVSSIDPVFIGLLNKSKYENSDVDENNKNDNEESDIQEKEEQSSPRNVSGMSAIMDCLELRDTMVDHLVTTFAGNSESLRKEVEAKIGNGRTSIARSPTVSMVQELLRPYCSPASQRLKEYQLTGVQWLLALHELHRCGILADEMGLGKTAQTVTFLNYLYEANKLDEPSIVACPATLVDNWIIELHKWAPNLRTLKYQGTQSERKLLIREFKESFDDDSKRVDVIVASLQSLLKHWDRSLLFKRHQFGYLIVDEAHNLKNSESQLYRQVRKISTERILLLTGSPIQNEIAELQNLLVLLLLPPALSIDASILHLATFTYSKNREQLNSQMLSVNNRQSLISEDTRASLVPSNIDKNEKNDSNESQISSPPSFYSTISNNFTTASSSQAGTQNRTKVSPEVEFLQQIFAPFILRRLKSEVINDLPPKMSIVERCNLEGRQKCLYLTELMSADSELARELSSISLVLKEDDIDNNNNKIENINAGARTSSKPFPRAKRPTIKNKQYIQNLMFRLRRICNHPLLYKGYYTNEQIKDVIDHFHTRVEGYREQPYERVKAEIETWCDYEIHQVACESASSSRLSSLKIPHEKFLESAKIRRMLEIVDETKARGSKALIFSQFTTYLDVITETLRLHRPNLPFFRLDGSTVMADRQQMVNQFAEDSDIILFLLSTKAGGVGLNLTAADTVLLMDQDWNPHNDRQAEDRVHRLGQTHPVTIYRLCCRGTLEESILKCAKRKLHLDEAFGGNADFLSAAILKDCFSSTLATTAKNKPKIGKEEAQTSSQLRKNGEIDKSSPSSPDQNEDRVPRRLNKDMEKTKKPSTTENRSKVQKLERQTRPVQTQMKDSTASEQRSKKNLRTEVSFDKTRLSSKSEYSSPKSGSRTKKSSPKPRVCSITTPKKNNNDGSDEKENESSVSAPRRDALMNRFSGRKSTVARTSISNEEGYRKRKRKQEEDGITSKKSKKAKQMF